MPRWPPQTYCCYEAKSATKTESLEFVFIMKLLTKNNAIFPVPKAIQQHRRQEDFKGQKLKYQNTTRYIWHWPPGGCLVFLKKQYIYISLTSQLWFNRESVIKKQFWTRMVLYYSINLVNIRKTNRTVYPIFQHDMKIALSKVISSFIWCFTITYFIQDERRKKNIPHSFGLRSTPHPVAVATEGL